MPFWDIFKEKDEDRVKRLQQEASVAALERGEVTPAARHRIEQQVNSPHKFFSSTFSAKEYLLAREAGYEPISQVMGSSFMRVGWNSYNNAYGFGWPSTGELQSLSNAHRKARELAISRMRQEAELLGAHGIIGVHIKVKDFTWSSNVTEFTAVGTAIRIPSNDALKQSKHIPFTSTLSGQEFWQLYESGYWPTGVVMGNCTYYVQADWQTRSATNSFFGSAPNQELMQFSQGFSTARELAVSRLTSEIALMAADGGVDMDVTYSIQPIHVERNRISYMDMLFNFLAMGTAVTSRPDGKARISHKPMMVIDLARNGLRSLEFDDPLEDIGQSNYAADDDELE